VTTTKNGRPSSEVQDERTLNIPRASLRAVSHSVILERISSRLK
jgi:hypothetical protein